MVFGRMISSSSLGSPIRLELKQEALFKGIWVLWSDSVIVNILKLYL